MRILLIGILLLSNVALANNESESQSKLQSVVDKIKNLTTELVSDKNKQEKLQNELKKLDLEIAESSTKLKKTQTQLKKTEEVLAALTLEYEVRLKELKVQQDALREQIRGAFLLGQFDGMKLLLNQSDPNTLGRLMVYFDYFNEARNHIATQIQIDTDNLAQTRATQLLQQEKLNLLEMEQAASFAELTQQKNEQSAVVLELQKDIEEKNMSLETLEADKKALETVLANLRQQAYPAFTGNADKPIKTNQGRLSWPVQGKVLHRFGDTIVGSNKWQGILISAPEGSDVRSVYKGRVVYADWLRGFGLITIVDHGDGYMSLYAHNQSLYKSAGDWVDVNEPIAQVGKSGPVANPGLYFEIRSKGEVQNPMSWLSPLPTKS
ncbi:MAG: peptidoglycan DD-metalloendopeptidase family protein [Gammaproteobacteria bacterium]|jgi:septal ring factor EnvC (AmiA/AmiB activator)